MVNRSILTLCMVDINHSYRLRSEKNRNLLHKFLMKNNPQPHSSGHSGHSKPPKKNSTVGSDVMGNGMSVSQHPEPPQTGKTNEWGGKKRRHSGTNLIESLYARDSMSVANDSKDEETLQPHKRQRNNDMLDGHSQDHEAPRDNVTGVTAESSEAIDIEDEGNMGESEVRTPQNAANRSKESVDSSYSGRSSPSQNIAHSVTDIRTRRGEYEINEILCSHVPEVRLSCMQRLICF